MCEQHVNNEWSAKQRNLGNLTEEQVLNLNGQRKKTQIMFDVRSLPREKKKRCLEGIHLPRWRVGHVTQTGFSFVSGSKYSSNRYIFAHV